MSKALFIKNCSGFYGATVRFLTDGESHNILATMHKLSSQPGWTVEDGNRWFIRVEHDIVLVQLLDVNDNTCVVPADTANEEDVALNVINRALQG